MAGAPGALLDSEDPWTPGLWGPELRQGPERRHGQLGASMCLGRRAHGRDKITKSNNGYKATGLKLRAPPAW